MIAGALKRNVMPTTRLTHDDVLELKLVGGRLVGGDLDVRLLVGGHGARR